MLIKNIQIEYDNLGETVSETFVRRNDLQSYGGDATGVTACDDALDAMLADGYFNISSGTYYLTRTHTVDIATLKESRIDLNVEFVIRSDVAAFVFKNPIADLNTNGMRIMLDIPGGGYSQVAVTLRGSNYYKGPADLDRLTSRTKFGPMYIFNKQGAIKQETATSAVMDEGYGFSIDCNSDAQEIMVWHEVDVSCTGFTVAHAIGVGTNPLNFISSLYLKLNAWFSTYHFRDTSLSQAQGNVAGGIGDVRVRLQSQPHSQMQKVVHIENDVGFMSGCFFDLTIWDPNVYGYRAGVVDALTTNEYTNTMERLSYPLTRALNTIDASLFPVVNYSSTIQRPDILSSCDSELAKYLYLSTVTTDMSVLQACNAVKGWCNANGVRTNFEFKLFLGDAPVSIKSVFQPWINAIGDDSGYITLAGTYYNGIINSIRCIYEVNSIAASGKSEVHELLWTNSSGMVLHKLREYTQGTTAEIKAKSALQVRGFGTFDTTFNIPVWYDGNGSWLKADGAVAYSL